MHDRFRSGGWSFGTQKFKDVSTTRYARQTYIYSAISYLRNRNFDGLDIDWEYPKGGDDKKNYVLLLKGKYNDIYVLIYFILLLEELCNTFVKLLIKTVLVVASFNIRMNDKKQPNASK